MDWKRKTFLLLLHLLLIMMASHVQSFRHSLARHALSRRWSRSSTPNVALRSLSSSSCDTVTEPAIPSSPPDATLSPKKLRKLHRRGVGLPKGALQERYFLQHEALSGLPEKKDFFVLGIESSCDDTGVAVVHSSGKILSNVVYSQYKVHENFGGVVPSLAMEAHRSNIDIAVERAITEAGLKSVEDVDAIAVTKGPGLEICLRIGMRKAQELAEKYSKHFVTVHHLEAHCLVARLAGEEIVDHGARPPSSSSTPYSPTSSSSDSIIHDELKDDNTFQAKIEFPFLAFLASGGHTSILLCRALGEYEFLGGTIDDALGEAFDKAARQLGLHGNVSGGVAVEKLAQLYKEKYLPFYSKETLPKHQMRVPMREKQNCDFSYSGLKTQFRTEVHRARAGLGLDIDNSNAPTQQMEAVNSTVSLPEEQTAFLCHAFQDIAFAHVEDRLRRALRYVEHKGVNVNGLVVVGGVAANLELRRRLLQLLKNQNAVHDINSPTMRLVFPPVKLCTDNGVMAAWAGVEKLRLGISNAIQGQEVIAKWPLGSPITDLADFSTNSKKIAKERI